MSQNPTENQVQGDLYSKGVGIVNEYTFDPGICILPLAEDPPLSESELATWSPVVVLKLHAPYRIRKVSYAADKKNSPPIMPSPQSIGSFVFIGGNITIINGLNSGVQIFDWSAQSNYLFVENCVSRVQDGLVLGSPPWMWSTYDGKAFGQVSNIGAAAHSGAEVLVGSNEALQQISNNQTGELKPEWIYTIPSLYAGAFFNDFIVNGGIPIVPALPYP